MNERDASYAYKMLKEYCRQFVPLTNEELNLLDEYFTIMYIKKNDFLLETGEVCKFISFITKGAVRHFHIKGGEEKTCDITVENNFITDFQSFTYETPAVISLQALENTTLLVINKSNLTDLYRVSRKYETLARIMAENVAKRATEIAMSLSSDKPEKRYNDLVKARPDLLQRVPQKYIANFLGVSPESLSRIRKRITSSKKS